MDSIQVAITCSESSSASWSDEDDRSCCYLNDPAKEDGSESPRNKTFQRHPSTLYEASPLENKTASANQITNPIFNGTSKGQDVYPGIEKKLNSEVEICGVTYIFINKYFDVSHVC